MTHPTPALTALLAALEGTGIHPAITENTAPGALTPWRAVLAPLSCIQIDGHHPRNLPADDPDHDIDDLTGTGATRDDALRDLLRQMRRLTYAVHLGEMDLSGGSYMWRSLAWDGAALTITGQGRAALNVREVIAA